MTSRRLAAAPPEPSLPRFDRITRAVHWSNAALFFVLIATAAVLYGAPGTAGIGYRSQMKFVHLWSGVALPVPIVVGLVLSAAVRDDARRLARWSADDRRWWSRRLRRGTRLGKFNPGQKLNATFTAAGIVVMLMTGSVMQWNSHFRDSWRTGATFVHDWTALALGLAIVGHIVLAVRDRDSLRGMVSGRVSAAWARRERPRWHAELTAEHTNANDPQAIDDPR